MMMIITLPGALAWSRLSFIDFQVDYEVDRVVQPDCPRPGAAR